MVRRMPADELEPVTRSQSGRLLIGAGLLLAIGSAAVLVLTDDLRWLRFAIIAALWAALVGAFIAAKYRGRVTDRDSHAADLQQIYELELEREIAARREYELRLEQEIRAEADEKSRQDVAALREELRSLRQTLESLLGGEVMVERYALAQATRMRPLDDGRQLRAAPLKRIAAAESPPPEPMTEQFDRVRDQPQPPSPRRADLADTPAWPDPVPARPVPPPPPSPPPNRPVQPARPVQRQPAPPPVERPTIVPPTRRTPEPPPKPADPPWVVQEPARTAWEQRLFDTPSPAERSDRWFLPDTFPSAPEPVSPAPRPPAEPNAPARDHATPRAEEPPGRHTNPPVAAEQPGGRRRRPEPPAEPAGRRHAQPEAADSGGGRRHRAEGAPSWQDAARGGGHARPDEPSGSHASGQSVADLLARNGNTNPRRRRRGED
jgi:hypothetical protein